MNVTMEPHLVTLDNYRPLDMKGCICHIVKWHIHPFLSKGGSDRVQSRFQPLYVSFKQNI